jgi:hypothetical protein
VSPTICDLQYDHDPLQCSEKCGEVLCPNCITTEVIVPHNRQCTVCIQHTCHLCIDTQIYQTCWNCDVILCNSYIKDCQVACYCCDTMYCATCCIEHFGLRCICGDFRRCKECFDTECPTCGFMGIGGVTPPCPSPKHVHTNTKLWVNPHLDSPADPVINYSDYDSEYSGLSQFPPMFSPSQN